VFVDKSWRTSLGVAFYDRDSEIEEILKSIDYGRGTTLVLGPRNVGKSELIKYVVSKFLPNDVSAVIIDFRMLRASEVMDSITLKAEDVVKEFFKLLTSSLKVPDVSNFVLKLFKELPKLLRRLRSKYLVLVLDEYHLMSDSLCHALTVLESLAKVVTFYEGYEKLRLVVSDSEGWFTTQDALRKLLGYSVITTYVEPLPYEVMKELYTEFSRRFNTVLPFKTIFKLIGGCPGYVVEVYRFTRQYGINKGLDLWISSYLSNLSTALSNTRRQLGLNEMETIKHAYRLLSGKVKDDEIYSNPKNLEMIKILTEYNIAYVKYGKEVKPQLPIYVTALEMALDVGSTDILTTVRDELFTRLNITLLQK